MAKKLSSTRSGKPKTPKKGDWRGPLTAWAKLLFIGTLLGASLGSGVVLSVCYAGVEHRVEKGLAGPLWSVPGEVWSAPVEVWEGLRLSEPVLAETLVRAGYTRVAKASRSGDFSIAEGTVMVINRATEGFTPKTAEVLITFRDGRVRTVSPGNRVRFAPARLASLRGPDNEQRAPIPLDKMPAHLIAAVLAIEDARFYEHPGLDPIGLARALAVDLWHQEFVQGGSTLTQQVAKNLFLSHDRTATRKFQEVLMAVALERQLGKDAILELYLNEVYLGQAGGASLCGMEAASRAWFGKPVERVDLIEAATLAGAIASPNNYSPVRHPEASEERRNVVLSRMRVVGAITEAELAAAKSTPMKVSPIRGGREAPWAVDAVVEQIDRELGPGAVVARALHVHTTIAPLVQKLAEDAVRDGMAEVIAAHPKLGRAEVAVVVTSQGDVLASVGGRDWQASPFNRADDAVREVGSTIKPLTLLLAMEADPSLSPASLIDDSPQTRTHDGRTWTPANYDGVFVGPLSIRRAVATSRNIPALLLAEHVGLGQLKRRLRDWGLSRATDYPSVSLGGFGATPTELAAAYGVLATGSYHTPRLVTAVYDDGVASAYESKTGAGSSNLARWMTLDVMRSVMTEGTGKAAKGYGVGPGVAGKSGTTDGTRDAWFAGVAGNYSVVVWVGHDDGKALGVTGSTAALPIWARLVSGLGAGQSVPSAPKGLVQVEVCEATAKPACLGCEVVGTDWFREGQEPASDCVVPSFKEPGVPQAAAP